MVLTVDEILSCTQGILQNPQAKSKIKGISIDSRAVKKGELFIAIKGERFDGHDFINQVTQKGICGVIASKNVTVPADVFLIIVEDTVKALGQIAGLYRLKFSIPVIAITGSAGKTTSKEMIASVLSSQFKVLRNIKSFNNHIGVPLTIFQLNKSHQILILELGTSGKGEIDWLGFIAKPTIAIFTNVGESHLQGLACAQGVFDEKTSLINWVSKDGTVIFNNDNDFLKKLSTRKLTQKRVTYSLKQSSDFQAININENKKGKLFFTVQNQSYQLALPIYHNIYNALAAIVCAKQLGISEEKIQNRLEKFRSCDGRHKVSKIRKHIIIDDSYNANPVSFRSAIESLSHWGSNKQKIIVAGDMLELGEQSAALHQSLAEDIIRNKIDSVYAIGPMMKHMIDSCKAKTGDIHACHFSTHDDLHKTLKETVFRRDSLVLIKGSRGMKMETTLKFLEETLKINKS